MKTFNIKQSRTFHFSLAGLFILQTLLGVLFLRQKKLKTEHKTVILEQKLLRMQMNPHFMFNTLSLILHFINSNKNKMASGYLVNFCNLLRSTLESVRKDMVPIKKVIYILKNYLDLQKLLHNNKFEYDIQVDSNIDTEDMSIPPMLIQPFIENAIEYGIHNKKGDGRIDVRFFRKGKRILCEVEDDGIGREKVRELENKKKINRKLHTIRVIKDRIQMLNKKFDEKIRIKTIDKLSDNNKALGTKVLIHLPYVNTF